MTNKRDVWPVWLLLIALIALPAGRTNAQQAALKIGEKLPSWPDRPQGPLIINFWATWCGTCLEELWLLDSVKNSYPELTVLSVTYEADAVVERFFERYPERKPDRIRLVAADTLLQSWFPHQTLPHNIWVDASGVIRAITGYEMVSPPNIARFMGGESLDRIMVKEDVFFDHRKPFHIADSLIHFRSIFHPHIEGIGGGGFRASKRGLDWPSMRYFFGFNVDRLSLIWAAYTGLYTVNDYLVELDTRDSIKFYWPGTKRGLSDTARYPTREDWKRDNIFFYEIRFPEPVADSVFHHFVKRDLDFNLKISASFQDRERVCRIVTAGSDTKALGAYDANVPFGIKQNGRKLTLSNVPIRYLLHWITGVTFGRSAENNVQKEPFVNETGFTHVTAEIDIGEMADSRDKFRDVRYWERCLADQLGLDFNFHKRRYPVLVVVDLEDTE